MLTLVRGSHVLTQGPAGDLVDAAVAIEETTIAAVGAWSELRARYPDALVAGDGNGIVLPGFINCHGHFSEGLITGMAERMTLFEWLQRLIDPVARHLTREMARIGTMVKAIEMLQSGVTTASDMFCCSAGTSEAITPGVVEGLELVGLRGQVSFGAHDKFGDRTPAQIFAEHEALAAAAQASQRCGFRLGITSVLLQSPPLFRLSIDRSRREGWSVHTHFHEVREEVTACRLEHGKTTIEYAAGAGLLDSPVLAAHCVWVADDDIRLLTQMGASVAHNPVSNMILASGVCPVRRLQREGLAVGLGVDGPGSNDSQDMLEVIKVAALMQKLHHLDATAMTAPEVIRMATIDGARALGMEREVGSLEPGKQADVLLMDGNQPSLLNIHDPYQSIVYCASGREVSDVWVGGQRLLREGKVATVDLPPLFAAAREQSRFLVRLAGLKDLSLLAHHPEAL